ncbi:MAG: hypothetical protein IAA73_00525 [Bacteroidetes bacterium]|uniref:Beta-ketoacyl-[acyl-carrier-protein] synthase III C-terminal domain-containing protein n=1 Tax=Candidatus Gallipaludibacter merdavium TaxID=2840839 RepID=A0A9D9N3B3_9BACT|nr:hypothetical protein [Candidatus Gallipaludibacter merdavium]
MPDEKVPYNLEEFANLGGASIFSSMVARIREQLISDMEHLIVFFFGFGINVGNNET